MQRASSAQHARGPLGRLARGRLRSKFGKDANVACRGAIFVLLLSLPLLVDPGVMPVAMRWAVEHKACQPATLLFVVYSLRRNVGETVCLVGCAILGIGLALVEVALMYWLLAEDIPKGLSTYAVMSTGLAFFGLMVGLNFNTNTVVFGCGCLAVCWMRLLEADRSGLTLADMKSNTMRLVAQDIGSCFLGSLFGVLCVLLPYPLLAIRQAQDTAKELATALQESWGSLAGGARQERGAEDVQRVDDALTHLGSLLADSRLECMCSRRLRTSRRLLADLQRTLSEAFDCLLCLQGACRGRGFELDAAAGQATRAAGELLQVCTEVAVAGALSEVAAARVFAAKVSAEEATRQLCTKLQQRSATEALRAAGEEHLMEEQALGFGACSFARLACGYADHLVSVCRSKAMTPTREADDGRLEMRGAAAVFDRDAIANRMHVNFALRSWLALSCSTLVGYVGFGATPQLFDAGIAVACSLMLSTWRSSFVSKSHANAQGVALGLLLSQAAHAFLGDGTLPSKVALGIGIFATAGVSLFMRFHAENGVNAQTGLLLAAFGLAGLAAAAGDDEPPFTSLLSATPALGITLLADSFLAPRSVSRVAQEELKRAWERLGAGLQDVLEATGSNSKPAAISGSSGAAVQRHLSAARALAKEAAQEPHCLTARWETDLFHDSAACAWRLRAALSWSWGTDLAKAAGVLLEELKTILAHFSVIGQGQVVSWQEPAVAQLRAELAAAISKKAREAAIRRRDSSPARPQQPEEDSVAQTSFAAVVVLSLVEAISHLRQRMEAHETV